METNESILNKGVVSLNDRKLMGKVKGVVIDCENCGISHFLVTSSTTGGALVLPFEKSISVGDTFMTIQDREDFLPTTDLMARGALDDNFDLVGLKVYSRVGDYLGVLKSFDIDTATGYVAKIDLEEGTSYVHDDYVFFSREFVFVDDGTPTDEDVRNGAERPAEAKEAPAAAPFDEPAEAEPVAEAVEEVAAEAEAEVELIADQVEAEAEQVEEIFEEAAAVAEEQGEAAEETFEAVDEVVEELEAAPSVEFEAEPEPEAVEAEAEPEVEAVVEDIVEEEEADEDDPDAVLKAFLAGKTLNERVVSADGSFTIEAGETITDEVLEAAAAADALLLLTMSVDE